MYISLDLETTGIDPKKDKIIEFGAIKFDLNGNSQSLQFVINPGITLPQIITHITGIKDSDLAGAPSFEEKKQEIINFIGDCPIVGHNIGFDTAFLRNNGIEINNPEYDTVTMTSALLPSLPSYSLEIISGILDLKHEEKHRALDDSIAAMELFLALIEKFKELDNDLIKEIKEILKKSDWPLSDVLIEQTPTTKKQEKIHKKIVDENQQSLFSKQEDCSQIIKAEEKTYSK
jgi:DNA polymerase III epsilon subunit-like protein